MSNIVFLNAQVKEASREQQVRSLAALIQDENKCEVLNMKHTEATKTAARNLFDKLEKFNRPLAVFVIDGLVRRTNPTTELFAKMLTEKLRCFMGVYNDMAMPAWLEDDLAYMGVR